MCRPSQATIDGALSWPEFHLAGDITSDSRSRPSSWSSPVAPYRPTSRSRRVVSLERPICLAGRPFVVAHHRLGGAVVGLSPAQLPISESPSRRPASSLCIVSKELHRCRPHAEGLKYGKDISKRCHLLTQFSLLCVTLSSDLVKRADVSAAVAGALLGATKSEGRHIGLLNNHHRDVQV